MRAQLASGSFQRQMQRSLLLGGAQDHVGSRLSGDYFGLAFELTHRLQAGPLVLRPYLTSDYVQVANDGFAEAGTTGFGLQARAWDSRRWQAGAGLRAERDWRSGDVQWTLDARMEWRRTLASAGTGFDASFTGLAQWAPLQGMTLASQARLFGLGLGAQFGRHGLLRFDLGQRDDGLRQAGMAQLQAGYRF